MGNSVPINKSPLNFFLLVFALSIPFWILGALPGDFNKILPANLPISALMTFCPLLAAVMLVYKERKKQGVQELLKLSFDFQKIKDRKWYIPIIFLMPVIAMLSYWYMQTTGATLSEPKTSLLYVCFFFFVFFIGAIGEEVGWSGYVIKPLQNRYGALKASMMVGLVWAIWHIIPYCQMHQTTGWIVWQCIGMVFLRIIMVWIFNNAGKSVFAMVLFHTMINISPFIIGNYGAHYDPFIFGILLVLIATIVVFLWGSKTLDQYRYA